LRNGRVGPVNRLALVQRPPRAPHNSEENENINQPTA
jgi:hypothetical protein